MVLFIGLAFRFPIGFCQVTHGSLRSTGSSSHTQPGIGQPRRLLPFLRCVCPSPVRISAPAGPPGSHRTASFGANVSSVLARARSTSNGSLDPECLLPAVLVAAPDAAGSHFTLTSPDGWGDFQADTYPHDLGSYLRQHLSISLYGLWRSLHGTPATRRLNGLKRKK